MRVRPCKKCGSTDIKLWDCGYSSFNPGGGRCQKCGYEVRQIVGCFPEKEELARIWNYGQRLTEVEKLKRANKRLKQKIKQLEKGTQ